MNDDHALRAADLLLKTLEYADGDEKIAISEDAVREADLGGHFELQFRTHEALVRACTFGGEPEKALIAFSWLMAHFDTRPESVSEWSILWKYKWIISSVHEFPHISKSRIYEMFDDFEAYCIRCGFDLKAAYNFRYRFERFCGNREQAIKLFRKMEDTPDDELTNCVACLRDERVSFAIYCGMSESAVDIAEPILAGEQKCTSVPHRTYAKLLLPLLRLGRNQEARTFQRTGYPLVRENKAYLDRVAQHLTYLAITGELDRGLRVFEKHVGWIKQTRNLYHHFLFYVAAWLLFEAHVKAGQGKIKMQRPEDKIAQERTPEIPALTFQQKATALAARFDERNETDHFTTLVRNLNLSNAAERLVTL